MDKRKKEESSPYSAISRVYDRWNTGISYERVVEFMNLGNLLRMQKRIAILDLCCGTGNILQFLPKHNILYYGLDSCSEMLEIAKKKIQNEGLEKQVNLFLCDVVSDKWINEKADLILCTGDSANYLSQSALTSVFSKAYHGLKPGGLFVFDLNTEHKIMRMREESRYCEVFEDYGYIWFNEFNENDKEIHFHITLFIKDKQSRLYERFDETHTQYIHNHRDVLRRLKNCGFQENVATDDYTERLPVEATSRISYKATKRP